SRLPRVQRATRPPRRAREASCTQSSISAADRRNLVDWVRVFDRTDCRTWLASTLMEKRTQRGHSRQSTDRSAAGRGNALAGGQYKCGTKVAYARLRPALTAERSVLCPPCPRFVRFSMSVETSYAPSPAHRCLGLDRSERRCRP